MSRDDEAGGTLSFFCINCRSQTDPGFKACPYCGDPITDFLRKYTEEPIDSKYKILSRLGIGGMGEVYKVLHLHLNAPRVVKMMRPALSEDERAHERFVREAQLATRIQHPNVAALFDFSTLDDGAYYMVWEYIDGITFAELLRAKGFLSPRYAAHLSLQVLDGLQAIHRQGVVHRDISPENVMITFDDEGNERVKIIDLGIAKQWTDETDDQTKTGMFVGKWKYCSPEHLGMLKPEERIDGRADLYSYGIVLYELLTGRVPFVADSPHRFLLLHSTETAPPLNESNPELGDVSELEAILMRALEKDREKRFRSAKQFASALEAVLPTLPDTPGLPPGAASPEITGEKEMGTVEVAQDPTDDDEATLDVRAPESETDETVESSRLEIDVTDAPFVATDPHMTGSGDEPDPTTQASFAEATVVQETQTDEAEPRMGKGLDQRTLMQAPLEEAEAHGVPAWVWAAVIVVVLIGVVVLWMRGRSEPVVPEPSVVETPAPVPAPSVVGIHAWPWGEVMLLENLGTSEQIEIPDPITPVAVDLDPGTYRVVLRHPDFGEPVEKEFEVVAGTSRIVSVQFGDFAGIELPELGGDR